ncbi:MAG: hypothetical protein A3H35_12600 [Betaproteobacteria bacterium RIFCSPLOWO2_02_FULL_62_17]|nr:MAG: hypothetical protein A3H35_12600 [Betaproteobacteria bacterium RIFCSPLOWO2_02_FULL_62_17]
MNNSDEVFEALAACFRVLSEPTRLKIMHAVCEKEMSVSQIVEELGATQTNISRHLGLMHRGGVLLRRKQGSQVYYRLADAAMADICRSVCSRIAGQLDARQPLRGALMKLMPRKRAAARPAPSRAAR